MAFGGKVAVEKKGVALRVGGGMYGRGIALSLGLGMCGWHRIRVAFSHEYLDHAFPTVVGPGGGGGSLVFNKTIPVG